MSPRTFHFTAPGVFWNRMHVGPCLLLAIGTIVWFVPFIPAWRRRGTILHSDRRARWGMLLEAVGYSLLWQGAFWTRTPGPARVALSACLFCLAALLSWTASRSLGRHLHLDAAMLESHALVKAGPYRFVRHPIYTSMLCILLATGLLIAPWYLLLPALVIFLAGTEIRLRLEEKLLSASFGQEFEQYRSRVSALIPLLR